MHARKVELGLVESVEGQGELVPVDFKFDKKTKTNEVKAYIEMEKRDSEIVHFHL